VIKSVLHSHKVELIFLTLIYAYRFYFDLQVYKIQAIYKVTVELIFL